MFIRKLLSVTTLALSMVAPAVALAAEPAAPSHCALEGYQISSVSPYRVVEHLGKGTLWRLRGAEIHVEAQPGLTAEWLQLTLQRHLEAMRGAEMKDCVLDADVARVAVSSAGSGFTVRLIANDTKAAEEVLRRARVLAGE
jgi:hypothetical protein